MQIHRHISLKSYNSFGIEAQADQLVEVTSIVELQEILRSCSEQKILFLGGGSNILLLEDVKGLVVLIRIKGIEILSETDKEVIVKVGAGEVWHEFVQYAIQQNWGGIENLSLIPGTVGAAPMQNIGAYGVEVGEVVSEVHVVERSTGNYVTIKKEHCAFGYRESVFKNIYKDKYVIVGVTFRLSKQHVLKLGYGDIQRQLSELGVDQNPTIKDVSEAIIAIRSSKLPNPAEIGNAGSFFKNPEVEPDFYNQLKERFENMPGYQLPNSVKIPAGWLIEQAGWKGYRTGDIGVHTRQALVLVNYGAGTGRQIQELSKQIQQSVWEKFGIRLTPEVNFIEG